MAFSRMARIGDRTHHHPLRICEAKTKKKTDLRPRRAPGNTELEYLISQRHLMISIARYSARRRLRRVLRSTATGRSIWPPRRFIKGRSVCTSRTRSYGRGSAVCSLGYKPGLRHSYESEFGLESEPNQWGRATEQKANFHSVRCRPDAKSTWIQKVGSILQPISSRAKKYNIGECDMKTSQIYVTSPNHGLYNTLPDARGGKKHIKGFWKTRSTIAGRNDTVNCSRGVWEPVKRKDCCRGK